MPQRRSPLLAIAIRQQQLALAVISNATVLEVRRSFVGSLASPHGRTRLQRSVQALIDDYAITHLVAEPHGLAVLRQASSPALTIRALPIAEARTALLGASQGSHRDLFAHLVNHYPALARLVSVLPSTGTVAMTERTRTVSLLAVALGLAGEKLFS